MKRLIRKGEWLELQVPGAAAQAPGGWAAWLQERLAVPADYLEKMRRKGEIRQNGNRVMLRFFAGREYGFTPSWRPLEVLYEDDFCLVVDKPAGVAVHPAHPEDRDTLAHAVAAHYEATGQQVAVRHIHRLDRWTSGPVLYAKNAFSQFQLDHAMREGRIGRTYLAVVQGVPAARQGTIRAPIGRDRHVSGKRRVSPGGAEAVTHYAVIETFPQAALLSLRLETGRTHQIRVHLAHIGHPIFGDALYGGDTGRIARQALHGAELRFVHPLGLTEVAVTSPLPADMEGLLEGLRREAGK